jgi:GT2 family glycosyltransferase
MGNKQIGIVTVTYNSAKVIEEFMASALAQEETCYKLYIVDNASTDSTLDVISNIQDARVIIIKNSENLGVAAGNNQGILASIAAGCEWVCLLNNDTVFGPEMIGTLASEAVKLSADMIVPKMLYHDHPDRIWCAGGKFNRLRAYGSVHFGCDELDEGQYDFPKIVEYTPTCCMLINRSVFDKIGIMDETYFVYADDNDFCLRAKKAGIRLVYTPETRLYHKVGSLTGGKQSVFTVYYNTRNRAYYIRKNLPLVLVLYYLFAAEIYFIALWVTGCENWERLCLRQRAHLDGIRLQTKVDGHMRLPS